MAKYYPETVILQTGSVRLLTKPAISSRRYSTDISASLASVPRLLRNDGLRGFPSDITGTCTNCLEDGKKLSHACFQSRRDHGQSSDVIPLWRPAEKSFKRSSRKSLCAMGDISGGREGISNRVSASLVRDSSGLERHDHDHCRNTGDRASQSSGTEENHAGRRIEEANNTQDEVDADIDYAMNGEVASGDSAAGYDLSLARLETASVSQALTSTLGRRFTGTVGSIARTAPRLPRVSMTGSTGLLMAVAVTVAGITSAVRTHMHHTREWWMQNVCSRCDGHGVERCHVCNGVGEIRWEGKLTHTDPCPGCLGDGYRQCRQCLGDCNFKKGLPEALEKTISTRKRI